MRGERERKKDEKDFVGGFRNGILMKIIRVCVFLLGKCSRVYNFGGFGVEGVDVRLAITSTVSRTGSKAVEFAICSSIVDWF